MLSAGVASFITSLLIKKAFYSLPHVVHFIAHSAS
jgi:hypothetical protein